MADYSFKVVLDVFQKYLPLLQKFVENNKDDEESNGLSAEISEANSLFKREQYEEALEAYREIAKKYPESIRPKLGEIAVHRKQNNSLRAIAACGMALEVSNGDSAREGRVYNTMGVVSVELFEVYFRKSDIDEAIYFFGQAESKAEDIYIVGNLVGCCLNALANVKKLSKEEGRKYIDLVSKKIEFIKHRLIRGEYNEYGIEDVEEMIKEFEEKGWVEMFAWLNEKLMDLRRTLETLDIERETRPVREAGNNKGPLVKKLTAALAGLAMISMISGFQFLDGKGEMGDEKESTIIEQSVEQRKDGFEQAKDVWHQAGLVIFTLDESSGMELKIEEEVHEWQRVAVREPGIDRMTS